MDGISPDGISRAVNSRARRVRARRTRQRNVLTPVIVGTLALCLGILACFLPVPAYAPQNDAPNLAVEPDAPSALNVLAPSPQAGALLKTGLNALQARDNETAINAFTGLLVTPGVSDADKAGFLALRGTAYQNMRLSGNAVADFTSALIVGQLPGQGRVSVLFSRAMAYDDLGLTERAVEDLNEVIAKEPLHGPALNNRANINRRLSRYEAALADYQSAINTGYSKAYLSFLGKGLTFEAMNRKDDALAAFIKAFEADPENRVVRQKLADYGALKGNSLTAAHKPAGVNGVGVALSKPAIGADKPAMAPAQLAAQKDPLPVQNSEVIIADLAPLPAAASLPAPDKKSLAVSSQVPQALPASQVPQALPASQIKPATAVRMPIAIAPVAPITVSKELLPGDRLAMTLAAAGLPESKLPQSKAPDSQLPDSKTPPSSAPDSALPDSKAPPSKAPETAAPVSKAPESDVPESATPSSNTPKSPEDEPEAKIAKPDIVAGVPQLRLKPIDELLKPSAGISSPARGAKLQTPAKAPAAKAPHQGGPIDYEVQLAAYRSAEEAAAGWKVMNEKFAKPLSGLVPIVERADLGSKGVYFRLRAGPFASRAGAQAACSALKAQGQDCMLVDS